jgi:hypothetical protein
MADSSDIDNALMAKLGADAQLLALMPNGIYWDVAIDQVTRFVIVSLVEETDAHRFNGRSHEDALYLVKAVGLSKPGFPEPDMKAAAARIDALLDNGTLTVAGYSTMAIYREARDRHTEVDDADPKVKWHHRGGHYRVVMSL